MLLIRKATAWIEGEDRLNQEEYLQVIKWSMVPGVLGNAFFFWYLPHAFKIHELVLARAFNVLAFLIFYAVVTLNTSRSWIKPLRWAWCAFVAWHFFIYPWVMLIDTGYHLIWLVSIAVFGSTAAFMLRSFDIALATCAGFVFSAFVPDSEPCNIARVISVESPIISTIGIVCLRHMHHSLIQARTNLALALVDAQHQEALKDEFIENAAHELRTPLSVIAALIATKDDDTSIKVGAIVAQMKTQVDSMVKFREAGTVSELNISEYNVESVVRQSLKHAAVIASSSGLNFHASMMHCVTAHIDEASIQTLLSNLVNNAIKFTKTGTVRAVIGTDAANRLVIKVTDTGVGIPATSIDKIFDRYYREPNQLKRSGFGVGLSVVKSIVDQYDGTIKVKSEEGKGTAFIVKIPCKASMIRGSKPVIIASARPAVAFEVHASSDVVLVEDNQHLREVLHTALEEAGYKVSSFTYSPDALAHVVSSDTKVLVLDVNMPQLDAGKFYGLLEASGRTVPTIFMSGYSKDTASKTIGFKPQLFIEKPFSNSQLVSLIRGQIGK